MNNPQKITATTAVVGVVSAVVVIKTMNVYYQDIYSRFPDLDRKVARKAFRRFLWHTYRQENDVEQHLTDEEMDVLFLQEVRKLTNPNA